MFNLLLNEDHKQYLSQQKTILTYMTYLAQGNTLSQNKFRDITPDSEAVCEFKSKHLRVYAIKKQNGRVIIWGGLKSTQKKDFKQFRSLKT